MLNRIVMLFLSTTYAVALNAHSQPRPDACMPRSGTGATLIVTAGDDALRQEGVTVRVFSSKGICSDEATLKNGRAALTARADDPFSPGIDGILPGQNFELHVFRDSASHAAESRIPVQVRFETDPDYLESGRTFVVGGIYHIILTSASGADTTKRRKEFTSSTGMASSLPGNTYEARSPGFPERIGVAGQFDDFRLYPNYPNPASSSTTVEFAVPKTTSVVLLLYDVLGRKVAELLSPRRLSAGKYRVRADLSRLAGGAYVLRLLAGGRSMDRIIHVANDR